MLLSHLRAGVPSGTRSSCRANTFSLRHRRATRGASARRGASGTVWRFPKLNLPFGGTQSSGATQSSDGTQRPGGNPPKDPPGQNKALGGPGDPQGRGEASGLRQAAIDAMRAVPPLINNGAVALLTIIGGANTLCGIFGWNVGLATKADMSEIEGRMKERVDEVKQSVKDSEKRMQTSVKDSEERVQKSVDSLKESLQFVVTWPVLLAVMGIAAGAFVAGKGSK